MALQCMCQFLACKTKRCIGTQRTFVRCVPAAPQVLRHDVCAQAAKYRNPQMTLNQRLRARARRALACVMHVPMKLCAATLRDTCQFIWRGGFDCSRMQIKAPIWTQKLCAHAFIRSARVMQCLWLPAAACTLCCLHARSAGGWALPRVACHTCQLDCVPHKNC